MLESLAAATLSSVSRMTGCSDKMTLKSSTCSEYVAQKLTATTEATRRSFMRRQISVKAAIMWVKSTMNFQYFVNRAIWSQDFCTGWLLLKRHCIWQLALLIYGF